jgi:hypothetical protein
MQTESGVARHPAGSTRPVVAVFAVGSPAAVTGPRRAWRLLDDALIPTLRFNGWRGGVVAQVYETRSGRSRRVVFCPGAFARLYLPPAAVRRGLTGPRTTEVS